MTPQELAARHFREYKMRGEEIVPTYCPFCEGGKKNEKHTFGMNAETGAYNCKRANSCNVSGSFYDLCKHFGEHPEGMKVNDAIRERPPKKKQCKKPNVKTRDPGTKVEKYLKLRGFSSNTWQRRKVSEKDGNMVFPYYENGELVLVKYRVPSTKEKRIWQEGGGKPVLWGMDDCDPGLPLVITEGEMDTLALDEAGVRNAVSVPFGAENHEWIKNCWEFIDQFKKIIIWPDRDEAGQDMLEAIIPRLGEWRCFVVNSKHKDANVQLYKEGRETVKEAVNNAEEVPIKRLVKLSEVKTLDPAKMERSLSGISGINRYLGGYIYGTITVWTGDNAAGKSSFLGQEMIECIEQNIPVVIYSGELPHGMLRYWLHLQMAGVENIRVKEDYFVKGKEVYYVPERTEKFMQAWYEERFYLYDHLKSTRPEDIIEVFTSAARRYGCKVFLVDNLMAVNYGGSKGEYYHRQSEFVTRLKEFADKFSCHVHIIAHPNKTKEGKLGKDDIAGLKEITNKADNVMAVHRIEDENRDSFDEEVQDCNTVIDVLKSRIYGKQNVSVGLMFSEMSKRFYMHSSPEGEDRRYSWAEYGKQKELAANG